MRRTTAVKPSLTFLIDSREQLPFRFGPPRRKDFASAITRIITLREGDYTVAIDGGAPLSIRLERKSLGDLYGCIGFGRERFERELQRLTVYEYRAIIVEGSLAETARGAPHSRVHPKSCVGSLIAWSVRYGLGIWFADSHHRAGEVAQKLLEAAAVEALRRQIVSPIDEVTT
jgi:ERCC4-type nuclease